MRKYRTIGIVLLLCLVISTVLAPVVFAQTAPTGDTGQGCFLGWCGLWNLFSQLAAYAANLFLEAASWLVAIAGSLLNVSIVLTLHIRDFVNSTPAIYNIWTTIRDITGLFFIFFLLFAAFNMILSRENNYGKLVVNIVIAGILVNFSFFLTSAAIDASNIVSQALYNAMLPTAPHISIVGSDASGNGATSLTQIAAASTGYNTSTQTVSGNTVGISNIFMQNLRIQSLYDAKGNSLGTNIKDPLKILLIGIVGVIIMITTAISFVLAAAAFIVRLVVLLFLLAFSPLWFAATVIPQLKPYTKMFTDQLKNMLLFMPVYLLLMYAALRVLNESNIIGSGWTSNFTGAGTGGQWAFGYIVLAINFAMVIVMLNLPLVVSMSMGGKAVKFINTKAFGAQGIWGKVSSWTGRNTAGKLAYMAENSQLMGKFAKSSPFGARVVSNGLSSVSSTTFGGGKKSGYVDVRKARIEQYKKIAGKAEKSIVDEDIENNPELSSLRKNIRASTNLLNNPMLSVSARALATQKRDQYQARVEEIMKSYKNEKNRKNVVAKAWEQKGGKFNKDVAKAIRGKSKTEELWEAALKEAKEQESSDSEKVAEKKPEGESKDKTK